VRGLGDAARRLGLKGEPGAPVPFVSGNVSFYNESTTGRAIPPSPIVACFGTIDDYSRAVPQSLREAGSTLLLVGNRRRELGASIYYRVRGLPGGLPVTVDYDHERGVLYGTIDAIDRGLVLSAHDISEGGLVAAAFEMLAGTGLGADLAFPDHPWGLAPDLALFSESGGFLLEVREGNVSAVEAIFARHGVTPATAGTTADGRGFKIEVGGERLVDLDMDDLERAWRDTLPGILS
jgi:phosphoribosylformylglycinamidine synthase